MKKGSPKITTSETSEVSTKKEKKRVGRTQENRGHRLCKQIEKRLYNVQFKAWIYRSGSHRQQFARTRESGQAKRKSGAKGTGWRKQYGERRRFAPRGGLIILQRGGSDVPQEGHSREKKKKKRTTERLGKSAADGERKGVEGRCEGTVVKQLPGWGKRPKNNPAGGK